MSTRQRLRRVRERIETAVLGRARRDGALPTVESRLPWMGAGLEFGRDPVGLLRRCRDEHGPAVALLLAGTRTVFLLDPRDYGLMFKKPKQLAFDPVSERFGCRAFGYSREDLALVDAPVINGLFKPMLKGEALARLGEGMRRALDAWAEEAIGTAWRDVDLYALVADAIFRAGSRALFGDGFPDAQVRPSVDRIDESFRLLAMGVPAGAMLGCRHAQAELARLCDHAGDGASDLVRARRARFEEVGLGARGRGLMQGALSWAAQANTMPGVFWGVAHLLAHPEAGQAVRDELASGGEERPLTHSAISESLRLSAAPTPTRQVEEDVTLTLHDGTEVSLARGEMLSIYPALTHFDPEVFPDPERYVVDRFVERDGKALRMEKGGVPLKHAYLPWGGGVSLCPGRHFARQEVELMIELLIGRCDIEVLADRLPEFGSSRVGLGVLAPEGSYRVRVRTR